MTNLRNLAKGQPCLIRVPTVCSGNRETTVGCHVRLIGVSGLGLKSPDPFIAFGCSDCHAVVDGQRKSSFSFEQRRLMLLEGMLRTQHWLIQKGHITW